MAGSSRLGEVLVDVAKFGDWARDGCVQENARLSQAIEQMQADLLEKTNIHAESIKKNRLLEKKVEEECQKRLKLDEETKALNAKLGEKDRRITSLKAEVTDKDREILLLRKSLSSADDKTGEKDKEAASLKAQVTDQTREILLLRQTLNTAKAEVKTATSKLSMLKNLINDGPGGLQSSSTSIAYSETNLEGSVTEQGNAILDSGPSLVSVLCNIVWGMRQDT
jgi:chromosome segregation ATPase